MPTSKPPKGKSRIVDLGKKEVEAALAEGITGRNTDLANAEELVSRYLGKLLYCGEHRRWYAWNGEKWAGCQRNGPPQEAAKALAKQLFEEARTALQEADTAIKKATRLKQPKLLQTAEDAQERALRDYKWARYSQSARGVAAMLTLAESAERFAILPDQLDFDPMILNCGNGILELATGVLRQHDSEALCTKQSQTRFDPEAKCPTWEAFLLRVMGGSVEMVSYLQKIAGYSLSGSTAEQILMFHYGAGANGKSTFLGAIQSLLGDYGSAAPRNILMRSVGDKHPAEIMALKGVRFATCNEIDDGASWDEAKTKDLASSDRISARGMRQDWGSFIPTHKLHIAGNVKPQPRGFDDGFWRRMRLVPWEVTIPAGERDTELGAKLGAEYEGILAWAVRGCLAWQSEGLDPPECIKQATAAYRADTDYIGQFLTECIVVDPKTSVKVGDVRAAYQAFCESLGVFSGVPHKLNMRIQALGGSQVLRKGPGRMWVGVRLVTS